MKKIALLLLGFFFLTSPSYAQENCALEKKEEYEALLEKLKDIDIEMAMEARNAYTMVSGFEEFDDKEPRCTHINRLLNQMREHVELYK